MAHGYTFTMAKYKAILESAVQGRGPAEEEGVRDEWRDRCLATLRAVQRKYDEQCRTPMNDLRESCQRIVANHKDVWGRYLKLGQNITDDELFTFFSQLTQHLHEPEKLHPFDRFRTAHDASANTGLISLMNEVIAFKTSDPLYENPKNEGNDHIEDKVGHEMVNPESVSHPDATHAEAKKKAERAYAQIAEGEKIEDEGYNLLAEAYEENDRANAQPAETAATQAFPPKDSRAAAQSRPEDQARSGSKPKR